MYIKSNRFSVFCYCMILMNTTFVMLDDTYIEVIKNPFHHRKLGSFSSNKQCVMELVNFVNSRKASIMQRFYELASKMSEIEWICGSMLYKEWLFSADKDNDKKNYRARACWKVKTEKLYKLTVLKPTGSPVTGGPSIWKIAITSW